jgi:hypothetical protein
MGSGKILLPVLQPVNKVLRFRSTSMPPARTPRSTSRICTSCRYNRRPKDFGWDEYNGRPYNTYNACRRPWPPQELPDKQDKVGAQTRNK